VIVIHIVLHHTVFPSPFLSSILNFSIVVLQRNIPRQHRLEQWSYASGDSRSYILNIVSLILMRNRERPSWKMHMHAWISKLTYVNVNMWKSFLSRIAIYIFNMIRHLSLWRDFYQPNIMISKATMNQKWNQKACTVILSRIRYNQFCLNNTWTRNSIQVQNRKSWGSQSVPSSEPSEANTGKRQNYIVYGNIYCILNGFHNTISHN